MRKSNFALRLQPSLMAEARKVAEAEGVGVNTHALMPNAVAAINTANPCHTRTDREGIDGAG